MPSLHPTYTVRIPSQRVPVVLSVWENDPKAVTILFYPGTMASPHMYPIFLQELHRLGCNVVALHPLSHGDSPAIKKSFTFQDILHNGMDAQRWIEHFFHGPMVICGHSQGGILTLAHALEAQHSQRLAAIFPIGTLLPHQDEAGTVTKFKDLLRYKKRFLQFLSFFAQLFPCLPIPFCLYLSMKRVLRGAYKLRLSTHGLRTSYPLCFVASLFTKDMRKAEQEGSISCPVYLYTAKNDDLFSLQLMQKTLKAIKAPHKELVLLHGGGHLSPLSAVYGKYMAAHMAATCASLGLPLHAKQRKHSCNTKA